MTFYKLPDLFKPFEDDLRKEISCSEEPFLGLFTEKFGNQTKDMVIRFLRDSSNPFKALLENLFYFPALTSVVLVDELLKGVGRNGHFEVYPILEDMLNVKIQNNTDRKKLSSKFRSACLLLGVQLPAQSFGTHSMVRDYLYQAGLPLNYVSSFTEKSLRYSDVVGVPELGDFEALNVWQQGLIERLNAPFPKVAKDALQHDSQSYYAGVFVRLFQTRPGDVTNLPTLEQKIVEAFERTKTTRKAGKLSIPEVVLRDTQYGILLPASSNNVGSWLVKIDGKEYKYPVETEELFIPLEVDLIKEIKVRRQETEWIKILWEDDRNNRFLIFSKQTGRYIKAGSLAEDEIFLQPGDYNLVLRFQPTGALELEKISDSPELYLHTLTIQPGDVKELSRGPAKVLLQGFDVPALTLGNKPLRGVKGNEFYASAGLSVQIYLPQEYTQKSCHYTLRLRSACLGEDLEIACNVDPHGYCQINLEEHLKCWRSGVSRVQMALLNKDGIRPLARNSAVVWNGLLNVNKRTFFHCTELPFNLDETKCQNCKVDPSQNSMTFESETRRFFKFAFDDGQTTRFFTWAVPGIFINILNFCEDGAEERSISLGSALAVSKISRKSIKVFASLPGILKLGEYETQVNFGRVGSKTISLSTLLDYSTSSNNVLQFIPKDGNEVIPLVELVTPSTVNDFETSVVERYRYCFFETIEKIDGFRMTAKNLVNGEQYSVEFSGNENINNDTKELFPDIDVTVGLSASNKLNISYPIKEWPEGFWLITYHLQNGLRWGVVMNTSSEEIAQSVLVSSHKNASFPKEVLGVFCKTASEEEKVNLLLSLHQALMSRFAPECWANIDWLKFFWLTLCTKYVRFIKDISLLEMVFRAASQWSEEAIADGHVTTLILSGNLLNTFSFERYFYNPIKEADTSLLRCLSHFPFLGDLETLLKKQHLDTSVLFGFDNAGLVSVGVERAKGFSIQKYAEALSGVDQTTISRPWAGEPWFPEKSDLLGKQHYCYSADSLRYRYDRIDARSERRGRVLGMVKELQNCSLNNYVEIEKNKIFQHIDLGYFMNHRKCNDASPEEDLVKQEHLIQMERLISFLAQVCRWQVRDPSVLNKVLYDFSKRLGIKGNQLSGYIGYLLFLGEDLFLFYLMLWEIVFAAEYFELDKGVPLGEALSRFKTC